MNSTQNANLGTLLVNGSGMTLYIYPKDTPATSGGAAVSACTGSCASIWLPLLTNGAPTAGTGVTASMLGTLTLADGSTQVTYNGWPLYTYSLDVNAGDTNGLWSAISPAGSMVSSSNSAAGATTPAATATP